jgi:phage protein D
MAVTTTMTMASASKANGAFYVPQFKLLASPSPTGTKEPFPAAVLSDVVEINYKDKLEEIDSCELVVNNWDADNRVFKYIGSENLNLSTGEPVSHSAPNAQYWNIFDPCKRTCELQLGYAGQALTSMMVGNFVTYEPNFPQAGPPVLSVRMLNLLHVLRTKKYDQQYTTKNVNPLKDTQIAQWISQQKDPTTKQPRFPMKIMPYKGDEATLTYVIQKNQYDIDFLWQRARTNGYDLRVNTDGSLLYQPSTTPNRPVYQLAWGQSLLEFKPTLTVGNQYKTVTVRYLDRSTQKVVEVKLDYSDPQVGKFNKDLQYMLNQCDPREEQIVDKPFDSKDEATKYCASVFSDQLKRMVKATGTTIGLPNLRAGCKIQIGGVGQYSLGTRLSGTYFVTATTHTFNSNGYTTRFEARREDQGNGQ